MTKSSLLTLQDRVYPNGYKEDKTLCVKEVWDHTHRSMARQCSRKRGYGHDGLYCQQHARHNNFLIDNLNNLE